MVLSVIAAIILLCFVFHLELLAETERFWVWLFGPTWGHWFLQVSRYDYYSRLVVNVPIFLFFYGSAAVLLVSAAYALMLLVFVKLFDIASSPKASPLAFLIGMVGIMIALGKVALDVAKLF